LGGENVQNPDLFEQEKKGEIIWWWGGKNPCDELEAASKLKKRKDHGESRRKTLVLKKRGGVLEGPILSTRT